MFYITHIAATKAVTDQRTLLRADYLHCVILFSSLLVLVLATYTRGDAIGSPGKLYDLLLDASKVNKS